MAKFFNGKNWIPVRVDYSKDKAIVHASNGVIIAEIDDDGFIVIGSFRARLYNMDYQEAK